MTQTGRSPHGWPVARKCHWTYVGMMLELQMMISRVDAVVKNGSSESKYHGNTTGAQKRDAAIGQANCSKDHSGIRFLIHDADASPTTTASPAASFGGAKCTRAANTGPLKRNVCTYVPSEPVGMRP